MKLHELFTLIFMNQSEELVKRKQRSQQTEEEHTLGGVARKYQQKGGYVTKNNTLPYGD